MALSVVASVPVDSPHAYDLIRDLRSPAGPMPGGMVPGGLGVLVGGATAQYVDLSAETRWALPVVFALVLGISLVFCWRCSAPHRTDARVLGRVGDNTAAVAAGVQHTARPISAAAAIMVAVFGSFVLSDVPALQQMGFALAVALALAAPLVRLVLVPPLMHLFGTWNWWLPGANRSAVS